MLKAYRIKNISKVMKNAIKKNESVLAVRSCKNATVEELRAAYAMIKADII